MGSIHNVLRRGGLSSALKNFLGDTKGEGGLERYGETLMPTVDLWVKGERNILRDELLFGQLLTQAAIVAEFGLVGIGLPTASLDLLVVEKASVTGGANNFVIGPLTRATVAATATQFGTCNPTDQRAAAAGFVLLSLGNRVEGWAGTDLAVLVTNANSFEETIPTATAYADFKSGPWIVKPGGTLCVQCSAANVAMRVNFSGYVRAAKPGELVNV